MTGREIVLEDPVRRIFTSVNGVGTFLRVEKSFREWIVFDLQRRHFLVLVSGDGDELRLRERVSHDLSLIAPDAHEMNARLVFVQGVQHDLPVAVGFVRKLHLGERNRFLHPMRTEVRRLGVHIDRIVRRSFSFTSRNL